MPATRRTANRCEQELAPLTPCPRLRTTSLPLRSRKRDVAFGAEDVAIKVRNPLASARGPVEITYFGLDMRRHAVPVELRVAVDDVGGRIIAKLAIDADLF